MDGVDAVLAAVRNGVRGFGSLLYPDVITSYSIHYTKLYEMIDESERQVLAAGDVVEFVPEYPIRGEHRDEQVKNCCGDSHHDGGDGRPGSYM